MLFERMLCFLRYYYFFYMATLELAIILPGQETVHCILTFFINLTQINH